MTGSSTNNRATILNSPIPAGGFGRSLTSTERRALRALGWSVSNRAIVSRQVSDRDDLGVIYTPVRQQLGGGYYHSGIYVEF